MSKNSAYGMEQEILRKKQVCKGIGHGMLQKVSHLRPQWPNLRSDLSRNLIFTFYYSYEHSSRNQTPFLVRQKLFSLLSKDGPEWYHNHLLQIWNHCFVSLTIYNQFWPFSNISFNKASSAWIWTLKNLRTLSL